MDKNKLESIRKVSSKLIEALKDCTICPRKCHADRNQGQKGYCRALLNPKIYSYMPHHGEEPALSGSRGSGTIFFTYCNMKCVYCQNYYFSQLDKGEDMTIERLADVMLELQKNGCHNINLVSPTHYIPQIVSALGIAIEKGLDLPIVYNTSGYDLAETIRMLDGIIDIYMPDMRYADNAAAQKYSDAAYYVDNNKACLKEMHRQVGDLKLDDNGIAGRGLIVRLLALPENISGTLKSLRFIKDEISPDTYLSIMSQYYPTFKSYNYKEIARAVTKEEYQNIVDEAFKLGLNNGWIQEKPAEPDAKFLGTNIKPKKGNRKDVG